ncbi:CcdC protein [Fictibacillus macauensis ZFHKF-1]|uniref:CcdC protein n=1 Tax=Fictibacillus macauensis ZFHKF-1 TaxID=1196324 RepID=I8UJ63_9BACL|nr:CcdC protein domain-containing protein [Fictibacillus macauensis]EIT86873.1 CcdC protein [Fictibacillus macauensis ZFHKF-1]
MFLIVSSVFAVLMAVFIVFVRLKATSKPVDAKKVILPPFFMATGFLMFVFPVFRVTWSEAAEAFLVGCVFSLFLIKTSNFEKRGEAIYLKRSKGFVVILIALFLIRMGMKQFFGHYISVGETSGLFFIVAFGMILPWRFAMYFKFKKVKATS